MEGRVVAGLAAALACIASAVPAAEASFPGRNGLIAFAREGPPFSAKWSHEGARKIWVANPRSGRTRPLTRVPRRCGSRSGTWSDDQPSFSASGRFLVYVHSDECDPRSPDGIYVMRADGSGRRLIRREGLRELKEFPAFSPSGEFVAFSEFLGSTSVTRVGRPHRERELSLPMRFTEAVQPAWSSTGRLALTLSGFDGEGVTGHIGTVTPSGTGLRLVTRSTRDAMPNWSPTANRLVFQREKEEGTDVLVAPARGHARRRPRRLTDTRDAGFPVWSPDGRFIAFLRNPDSDPDASLNHDSLWVMRATDGGGKRLVAAGVFDNPISWQPRPRR